MADRSQEMIMLPAVILCLVLSAGAGEVSAQSGLSMSAGSQQRIKELISLSDRLTAEKLTDMLLEPVRNGITNGLEKYVLTATLLNRREILPPPKEDMRAGDAGAVLQAKLAKLAGLLGADEDWRIRRLSMELLVKQLSADAVPVFKPFLEDSAEPVRHRAIEVLGLLPKGENIRILQDILVKHDKTRAFDSVAAVRAMADLRHMPGLLEGLKDENVEVQLESVRGLARQPSLTAEAEKALRAKARWPADERVRLKAGKTLEKFEASSGEKKAS